MGAAPVKRYLNFTGLFVVALVIADLCLTAFQFPSQTRQDTQPPQEFPQTGHVVRDPFLSYFLQTGGVDTYGLPITDDYVDPDTHLLVQYFQNARLEWHPGNDDPYKVQVGLLGTELGKQQGPISIDKIPAPNDPNCQYFGETGHSLCYVFRDYWLQNGGLDRFGYPITEYTNENGLVVQYFQRARMEWHPEAAPGAQIQLAPLGRIYYLAAGFDPTRLDPVGAAGHLGQVTTLYARASVFKPNPVANDTQTAFVFVADQFGRPVSGVAVTLIISYPQGQKSFVLPPTMASGASFQTFALPKLDAGTIIPMTFVLSYPGLGDSVTRTSCMIWY
jgi:hypothetical protein